MKAQNPLIHISSRNGAISAKSGETLLEALIRNSIFLRTDCGGKGKCHKCRVTKISENGTRELIDSCMHKMDSDITISIPESSVSPSHVMEKAPLRFPAAFTESAPGGAAPDRYGIAVDLGTTTIAVYLCNLAAGTVTASIAHKNSQTIHGDDVMSRIAAVNKNPENLEKLHELVIRGIEWGMDKLLSGNGLQQEEIQKMVVVGNPTMIHIFLEMNPESIGIAPFKPVFQQAGSFPASQLGFARCDASVVTLPNVSGFIGGDILAAAVAADMERQPAGTLLIDLGTNGELMLKTEGKLYATSCATGPAFEGASLSCGMQAIPGAVNSISIGPDRQMSSFSVINPMEDAACRPLGICATGIFNAISRLCQYGHIQPGGALSDGSDRFVLIPENIDEGQEEISISQKDIRAIQLGKSALKSGIEFLLKAAGMEAPEKIIIAGTMGSYVDISDLIQLGMLPDIALEKIESQGNLAGSGAVMALVDPAFIDQAIRLSQKTEVMELATNMAFQNAFIENLAFPES